MPLLKNVGSDTSGGSNIDIPQKKEKLAGCENETLLMMYKRWKKIELDFVSTEKSGKISFDISKLPEICDNIVFDMIHYPELRVDERRDRLLRLSQILCMVNVPSEYGVTESQKSQIGM
jgi:inositol-hexakisphosphate/diphosphoinositol-pentakisphosphate 1-kinase